MLSYGDDTFALLWVSHFMMHTYLLELDDMAVNESLINGTIKVP